GIAVILDSTRQTRETLADEPSSSARINDRNLPLVNSQMPIPDYAVAGLALSRVSLTIDELSGPQLEGSSCMCSRKYTFRFHMVGLSVLVDPTCN
ncbi:hypothetical protein QR685DRAFT_449065, partial [Neurospora intermedia]